jgi:hypothetical protein
MQQFSLNNIYVTLHMYVMAIDEGSTIYVRLDLYFYLRTSHCGNAIKLYVK